MPDEFEWQTDVDAGWDQPEPAAAASPVLSRRIKLIALIVIIAILSGALIAVYTSLNRQVTVATDNAQSDALIAHALLADAALKADTDIVASLIARRPSSWYALQLDLLSLRLFYGRRPLAIEPDTSPGRESTSLSLVSLSPDLTSAEVADRRPYVVQGRGGLTETVILERTFLYDLVETRWQMAPAEDDRAFWGNWARDERDHLSLSYPMRDEGIALRLAKDLDEYLAGLCAASAVSCPADFLLELKLEIDPTSVRRLSEGVYPIQASTAATGDRLSLPAPTLAGIPVDEAGYQALYRGYAGWIGAAIVATYGLPGDATVDETISSVLAEFDLSLPPLPYQPLPRSSLAEFPPGAPTPVQDILLLCDDRSNLRLLRLHTDSGRWQEEAPSEQLREVDSPFGVGASYMSRLRDYEATLIQVAGGDEQGMMWRSYLWSDGAMRLLTEDSRPHYYLPPILQPINPPNDRFLAFFVPADEAANLPSTALGLDLDNCQSAPCELSTLSGFPVWSPDGRHTLVYVDRSDAETTLNLGDATAEVIWSLGDGQSPAWIDGSRFAYLSLEPELTRDALGRRLGDRVVLTTIDSREGVLISSDILLTAEDARQAIPEANRPTAIGLWTAQPALGGDQWWYIGASSIDESDQRDFILVMDPQTGEARVAADLGRFRMLQPPRVSPSGRYAVVAGFLPNSNEISVELVDASSAEMRRLPGIIPADWSEDESWLLQSESRRLNLVATETGQQWPVIHDLGGCYWAVWTNR